MEVGCRDFPVWITLGSIGVEGKQRRAAVKALGQNAETASSWIWLKRDKENGSCPMKSSDPVFNGLIIT